MSSAKCTVGRIHAYGAVAAARCSDKFSRHTEIALRCFGGIQCCVTRVHMVRNIVSVCEGESRDK